MLAKPFEGFVTLPDSQLVVSEDEEESGDDEENVQGAPAEEGPGLTIQEIEI